MTLSLGLYQKLHFDVNCSSEDCVALFNGSIKQPHHSVNTESCYNTDNTIENVVSFRTIPSWKLVIGAYQLSELNEYVQIRHIKNFIIHESYNPQAEANDIALIQLNTPVKYNNFTQPACLPNSEMLINEFFPCYIGGWGITQANSQEPADVLQEARVNQINMKVCNSSSWYDGAIKAFNLCAGYKEGGIDSCQGDSGGPLMCEDPNTAKYYVIGITSWGRGCASARSPGVYTNTQYFLEWILQKIGALSIRQDIGDDEYDSDTESSGLNIDENTDLTTPCYNKTKDNAVTTITISINPGSAADYKIKTSNHHAEKPNIRDQF
uniref:Acrosin n=1 Tax=Geotrypetes seraphini TaxID=260995 RepID=A0A6P8SD96_GEOSA|nr:acrosin-like [Geotrypetes seraphini]